VPAALALALALLVVGIVLGSRVGRPGPADSFRDTDPARVESASRTVIVCGLPTVEVFSVDPGRAAPDPQGGN
jgi:hypothetical protein